MSPEGMNQAGARKPLSRAALEFAPGLLATQESPPAPLPRAILYSVVVLMALLLMWAKFGKLDIIASAEGRLVPQTYIKIVQPAEAGIVKEILVKEGEKVYRDQVLLRMDPVEAEADTKTLESSVALKSLQLRRIDAELRGVPLRREAADPADLFQRVSAQYQDRRQAYEDSLAGAQEALGRARHEYESGVEALEKLRKTNPSLKSQADSYAELGKDGYIARVLVDEKQRTYLENTQDLRGQEERVAGLASSIAEARKLVNQQTSKYRSELQNERVVAEGEYNKLRQDSAKQAHKLGLLELRAPQAGIVKDLSTHTVGTVVSAGAVLLSLVPENEPLLAEVMVRNEDVGFVHSGQIVQVKLSAYPFQKYGMIPGEILQVWPDAAEEDGRDRPKDGATGSPRPSLGYKARVRLASQQLQSTTGTLELSPGMQVVAEINEGKRTVLEYLISPVRKTVQESGRER